MLLVEKEVRERMAQGWPLVVAYGGGVNSAAMVIGLCERGIRPDAIVFADVGDEKPDTYRHLGRVVRPWLRSHGMPDVTTVRRNDWAARRGLNTGDATLEAECLRLRVLPSRAYGRGTCSDKWKQDPQRWWAQDWRPAQSAWAAGGRVLKAIGYDADEDRRAKDYEDKLFAGWHPLRDWGWGREECEEACERAGVPVPVKSACFYCPSSTAPELELLQASHPDLAARAVAMERAALERKREEADEARAQGACVVTEGVLGLGRRFSWERFFEANAAQRSLFPRAIVEQCSGDCGT